MRVRTEACKSFGIRAGAQEPPGTAPYREVPLSLPASSPLPPRRVGRGSPAQRPPAHTHTPAECPAVFELWRDPGLAPSFARSAHATRETVSPVSNVLEEGGSRGRRGRAVQGEGGHGVVCSLRVPAPSLKPYPPAQELSEPHYFKNQRHFIFF